MKVVRYDEIVNDESQAKCSTPMNCSTCLYDRGEPYCIQNHYRVPMNLQAGKEWMPEFLSLVGGECPNWKINLSRKEMKGAEKEFDNTFSAIRNNLRVKYPHGHPKFLDLVLDEIRLHSDKNHDFAKGGNPLGNFNRVGAILDLYPGLSPGDPVVVAISFMLKQLDASLWMLSQGYAAKVEGHAERWRDIAIYTKIISLLIEEGMPSF